MPETNHSEGQLASPAISPDAQRLARDLREHEDRKAAIAAEAKLRKTFHTIKSTDVVKATPENGYVIDKVVHPLVEAVRGVRAAWTVVEPGEIVMPRIQALVDDIVTKKTGLARLEGEVEGQWTTEQEKQFRQELSDRGAIPYIPRPVQRAESPRARGRFGFLRPRR